MREVRPADDAALDALLRRFLGDADEAAMEEFVRATRPRLIGAARGIVHPQDAEDCVQSAYHALLRRGATPIEAPVAGWLLVAVIRIAYRRKAESGRRPDLARLLQSRPPAPDPSAGPIASEERAILHGAIDRLPSGYRDAVVLHHLNGLPVAAVAALQECPESTAKARVRRGRALLRSRLPRALQYGLLAGPWALEDAARWAAGKAAAVAGGIVKAKIAAAAVLVALVTAGAGAAWLLRPPSSRSPAAPSPRVRPAPAPAAAPRSVDEPVPPPPSADPPSASAPPVVAQPASAVSLEGVPQAVRDAAARLEVPDAALKAAWDAYRAGGTGNVPRALLDALREHGQDGFRAVVALLRADLSGTWFPDLVSAGWAPGLESLLIETAEDTTFHIWSRWSALSSLGRADTPASRDYLVGRVARETDSGLFWSASGALAELREPRGAASVAARIEEVSWGDVVRTGCMAHLAAMDPAMARDVLLRRLANPGSDLIEPTFRVLAGFDRDAAKREAEALLDGPRGRDLGPTLVWTLRDILGRPQKDPDAR